MGSNPVLLSPWGGPSEGLHHIVLSPHIGLSLELDLFSIFHL